MNSNPTLIQKTARGAVVALCLAICGVTVLALLGAALGNTGLAALGRDLVPMSPLCAILMLLLAGIELATGIWAGSRRYRWLGTGLLLGISLLSLAVVASQLLGHSLPIRFWPFLERSTLLHTSLLTAVATFSAALSILLRWLSPEYAWRNRQAAALLAQVPLVIGSMVLVSYVAGAPVLYGTDSTPMSLPAALCSAEIGAALMIAAGCDTWPMAVFGFDPAKKRPLQAHWFTTGPLALFLLLGVLVLTGGSFYLGAQLKATRAQLHSELATIAEFKVRQLGTWFGERTDDAKLLLESELMQTQLRHFLVGAPQAAPEGQLRGWMEDLQKRSYRRVVLFDQQGRARISVPASESSSAEDMEASEIQRALHSKTVLVQDLHPHPGRPDIHLSMWIPVGARPGPGSKAEGTLLLVMDPQQFLYPLVRSWPTPSPSAETLLIRQEGEEILYLNELRHSAQGAMSFHVPLRKYPRLPALLSGNGAQGLVAYRDYRAVPVLAVLRKVPGTSWIMVAKVDEAEVYGPLRRRVWMGSFGLIGLVVLVAAGLGLMVRHHDAEMVRKQYHLSQRFELLMREANDIILLTDGEGRIHEANLQAAEQYGYSIPELQTMRISDLRPPETQFETALQFERLKELGSIRIEILHRRRDGSTFPVEVSGRIIHLGGNPLVVIFLHDITERKRAREALQESEERYRYMFENNPQPMWIYDRETLSFLQVNKAAINHYGYSKEEFLSMTLKDIRPAEDVEKFLKFSGKSTHPYSLSGEWRHKKKGGESIVVEIVSHIVTFKGRSARHVLSTDITERKQAEEALRTVYTAMEQSPVSVVISDALGTIQYVNPAFRRVTGYSSVEALGQNSRILKSGLQSREFYREMWGTLASGHVWSGEIQNRKATGEIFTQKATISPVRDETGSIAHFVAIMEDITDFKRAEEERRLLEEQLHQSQKLESLGSLAGGVAHDMNNVLGAILSLSSTLREKSPLSASDAGSLDTIINACLRGRGVVKSLLYFAHKDLQEDQAVDLNLLVQEMSQLLSYTTLKRIDLATNLQAGLGSVRGDAGALSHALMNLCVNAMDAMPNGGTLDIRTLALPDGSVEVQVKDSGAGMGPEVLAKCMEPFFTTKPKGKGTGLGLSMVYGTMRAHEGHFDLQSQVGQGTIASLTFPASRVERACAPVQKTPSRIELPRIPLDILVVDDDNLMRESVAEVLHCLGHRTISTQGGSEALRLLEDGQSVDLVILDMNMPGMSGAEALPRILALRPGLAVLMATGYSDEDVAPLREGRSNVHSLLKPFSMKELADKLGELNLTADLQTKESPCSNA